MKLKATLLGAFFISSAISAVIVTAPTRANISSTNLTQTSKSVHVWQIFAPGSCTTREQRKRTNISRLRNDSCPNVSR